MAGTPHPLLRRALDILKRRAHSQWELREKLSEHAGSVEIEGILSELEQLNLLNDENYAYNFAVYRMQIRGWSSARVRLELVRRGVAQELIVSILEKVAAELDPETLLQTCIDKYCDQRGYPEDSSGIRRLMGYFRRRGFSNSSIRKMLGTKVAAGAWQRFEEES